MMSCCGSWYESQGLLLACRQPAALSAAGTRLPHHLAQHPWPAIGGSAIYCSALGVATSLFSSKHGLHEHNSFFSSAARGWQMAPCGAGDPFDCGRRARKSRWKATPAQNRRGSSCWSRKSRCCGLGTLRDCSLAAASVACSALTLTNAALAKPTATVALANPAIVIAASVVSQSAAAVALAATAVALSPPPGHHHRHRHRPRRHGLRHPSPWPSPSPPSPSPSPLPPLPSPLSPPPPPSPPSPLSRDAAPLSFDRASSRRFDWCAERRGFLLDFA